MGTAWTYAKDVAQDHVAIRTKAGLMDVSGLKKLHLVGPHASAVLNYATTRDITKIYPGKSAYACMLNDAGHFIEDCILYRTGPNSWMVVHGSGAGHETLAKYVGRPQRRDDRRRRSARSFPAGAGGGRLSGEACARHPRPQIFSSHARRRCSAVPSRSRAPATPASAATRSFCKGEDAGHIWDTILSEGKIPRHHSRPASPPWTTCASKAHLLFYPYDMSQMYPFEKDPPGDSLWELGLDFTVSPGKNDFNGADAHCPPEGQGALQDLRFAGGRQGRRRIWVIRCIPATRRWASSPAPWCRR